MDNKLVLKEKTSNEEFPGIFSDEYLANLNNAGEDIHLHTNENDDDFLTSLNTDLNLNYFPDNMKKNNEGSFMFSNSMIQNSILKQNNLKKVFMIKYIFDLRSAIEIWRVNCRKNFNPPSFQNKFIIEKLLMNTPPKNSNLNNNFLSSKEQVNNGNSEPLSKSSLSTTSGEKILSKLFSCKANSLYQTFFLNMRLVCSEKKVATAYLTLLVHQAHCKLKVRRITSESKVMTQRFNDYEKKINKLEQNLNEKAGIITKKNDTIETLTEQIESLNKKVKSLESKKGHFNVIHESLCSKCGNTLEESFISTTERHRSNNMEEEIAALNEKVEAYVKKECEYKRTIQEQLDCILKLEQDCKELRLKNIEYKSKNDNVIKELDNIKEDFRLLSQNFVRKSAGMRDTFTQTDELKKTNSSKAKSKSKPKIKANKKESSNVGSIKKPSSNAIQTNIKPLDESSGSSKGNNKSTSIDSSRQDRDLIQNLRYDNSLLTQEVVNLNKELMKLRTESKSYSENLRKLEKERNEIKAKFSTKFENYEKIKKENEELMIMIQTSNHKTFFNMENENKRLKDEIQLIRNELENIKQDTLSKEKKYRETDNEIEQNKRNIELITKFKTERENLILENTKLDSEIKRIRFEVEDIKMVCEKQDILIRTKDETINKLTQDLGYLSLTAKKSKTEAERAISDAMAFQQIVRKMEKELLDMQSKKEKAENDLNIFRQQLTKMKY